MENIIITDEEKRVASECIALAAAHGADGVRVSLEKSRLNVVNVLDGKLDKTSCNIDRSLYFTIFAEGRYGCFGTNRIGKDELEKFLEEAVLMTKALAPEPARTLPPKNLKANSCTSGDEMGICDGKFVSLDEKELIAMALKYSGGCRENVMDGNGKFRIISAESELSATLENNYVVDSDGFEGLHAETTFSMFEEVTVEDTEGKKYSGYWSESSPFLDSLQIDKVYSKAVERAAGSIGPETVKGGKYTVIVDRMCSKRLVTPLLDALDGYGVLQKNSFLADSLGKKVFPDFLDIVDKAAEKGKRGSRAFDSEGMACRNIPLVSGGTVTNFYAGTFIANKTGLPLTTAYSSRPTVLPFIKGSDICKSCKNEITLKDIFRLFPDAIYITAFNGGNCNGTTGNYSFGIEGIVIKGGLALHPVREILMTGNIMELWNSVAAAAEDASPGTAWQIPSLVFENVEINA